MTKRQRATRIRQVRKELVAKIQARFPQVEFLRDYVHPPDTVVIELYTPDENEMEISETVSERRVDLCIDEDLDIVIMPLREKPISEAA